MKKIVGYILALVFIAIIVVIAMQFFGPTIGDVFCSLDGDWCLSDLVSGNFTCGEDWKKGLPMGSMVVIVPKTLYVGNNVWKRNEMIGFAYSPSQFSTAEIDEKIEQFLDELRLDEQKASIVEFDIFMDVEGYPRIPIYIDRCDYSANRYAKGENKYIDPEGLTVWNLTYSPDGYDTNYQWSEVITIHMVHNDPEITYRDNYGSRSCHYMCEVVSGSASADVIFKHTIWSWIDAVWFNFWGRLSH